MPSIFSYADYREILRDELGRRLRNNPRYTQGAFARHLHIRSSRLCEILGGKQGLSAVMGRQIATRLGFSDLETERFVDLVESQHGRSRSVRDAALQRLRSERKCTFDFAGGWLHHAIIAVLRSADFRVTSESLNSVIDSSREALDQALEELVSCGVVRIHNGDLFLTAEHPQIKWISTTPGDEDQSQFARLMWNLDACSNLDESFHIKLRPQDAERLRALVASFVERMRELASDDSDAVPYTVSLRTQRDK